MIDNFAILFSTLMVFITAILAIRLDRERPWFEIKRAEPGDQTEPDKDAPVWRKR